jgi:hypothetical protein
VFQPSEITGWRFIAVSVLLFAVVAIIVRGVLRALDRRWTRDGDRRSHRS